MPSLSPSYRRRLRERLAAIAREECEPILKALKKTYAQLKPVNVRFEDQPDKKMVEAGVRPETESAYVPDEQTLILFLFNIHEHAGKEAADCRARMRRVLLKEIGDLVGEDFAGED